jgi:protein gp37
VPEEKWLPQSEIVCFKLRNAKRFAKRFRGIPGHPFEQGFDLRLVPEKLSEPLRWGKPRMISVNSMSDLFHAGVPEEYVRAVMRSC